ncbi:unnamed protein product, partial [Heterosigma akashiwo]
MALRQPSAFYDLSVSYYRGQTSQQRQAIVEQADSLGYGCIAFNKIIHGQIRIQDACIRKEIIVQDKDGKLPTQLTRATISVDSSEEASALPSADKVLQTYDIVAVRPTSAKAFSALCQLPKICADIISLDFSERLGFFLHKRDIDAAVARGMIFEVEYSPAIRDSSAKRHLVSNSTTLISFLRGRHIIFSSGSESFMDLRSPSDVMNISQVLGIKREASTKVVSCTCKKVLQHADNRR